MPPTILIVDDEKHTRDGLRASLEDSFEVYVAADIAGALSVLDGESFDLVLTDLRLGGEDGMQLIDKVLALPHPPIVIMMTAYGSVDAAVGGDEAWGLRLRDEAAEHRQAGDPDPSCAPQPREPKRK
jgi:DNA-binding NtrC family response regulator